MSPRCRLDRHVITQESLRSEWGAESDNYPNCPLLPGLLEQIRRKNFSLSMEREGQDEPEGGEQLGHAGLLPRTDVPRRRREGPSMD